MIRVRVLLEKDARTIGSTTGQANLGLGLELGLAQYSKLWQGRIIVRVRDKVKIRVRLGLGIRLKLELG
jgi:hypothetical protein